ncbi:MAG TPA: S1 RNA-binding domain-containing protein [Candidatus Nanoperiomorbaceae bacterium]|jgi:small subunit ribosomal protein S1|nr:MAG: S1 RNA-binding domain-containing protein [Candidatus Saccharibacteria bacterium]HMQ09365.1 S1 RNA-binding domain-containing protein [Candidatus Nanoperiomorbaceae bacterium]HMQ96805.1 S1 RNA-binding domain-containing protein [Candidatus Nanoperiomorbaceae bacterium]HMR86143.1 S1 RNA-binding domain-containing protein [Candidatus Nanoperiomorbaceae bacterium]HMU12050.1 S1 RNA-binding domain-containing protein [Candidatus Nanoperiomorbaceae bacterium]
MAHKMTMDDLLNGVSAVDVTIGDVIDGKILSVKKNEVLVDLGVRGVGLVPRREIGFGKKYVVGDEVAAAIVDTELDSGYVLLSLRKAAKDRGWDEIQKVVESGKSIEVTPYDANRGGLLIEYEGVRGFMPVSQLSAEHYPRVTDKDEILKRLRDLIGKPMSAQVIDVDQKANKLIFSEKEAIKDGLVDRLTSLKVGDVVKGIVTGIVDFGAFVNVDGIEGLIHISEISWERIATVAERLKVGDVVEAKIISIDKDRLSLSIKQTTSDPWLSEAAKFHVGDEVEGTITRITPFGAFVQISPAVEALVHISELGDGNNPEKLFQLNEKKKFAVIEIDADNRKISLGLTK